MVPKFNKILLKKKRETKDYFSTRPESILLTITDPQTVYPVYTEKGCEYEYAKCGNVTQIIISPKLRFIRAIRICTT